jgi:hypothetical protein
MYKSDFLDIERESVLLNAHNKSFLQQGQKCIYSAKELLFYSRNRVEAAEHKYPCRIKLRSVMPNS